MGTRLDLDRRIANAARREGYLEGVRAAADLVKGAGFDEMVDHPFRLSDVILCKFNLISKRQMRKTPPRRTSKKAR